MLTKIILVIQHGHPHLSLESGIRKYQVKITAKIINII